MRAIEAYLPLLQVPPIEVPSWSLLGVVDLVCIALLLLAFLRALGAQGLPPAWRTTFVLLALGQAGLAQALSAGQGLGVLLLAVWLLGFGLASLRHGPAEQAYLSLAFATPLLALFGLFGLSLALASIPAALHLRHPQDSSGLAADTLLASFPLTCTLLALAFFTWMKTGTLAAMPLQDASTVTSLSHPWAQLMGGRFFAPFFLIIGLLLFAAPALLVREGHSLRILLLTIAIAGALTSFMDALPTPRPLLVLGAAVALLVPVMTSAAANPAKAALGLAAAMGGSWFLVLVASTAHAPRPIYASNPQSALIGSFAPDPVAGAWGVRDSFARAHPGRVPRLERHGSEYVYVLID